MHKKCSKSFNLIKKINLKLFLDLQISHIEAIVIFFITMFDNIFTILYKEAKRWFRFLQMSKICSTWQFTQRIVLPWKLQFEWTEEFWFVLVCKISSLWHYFITIGIKLFLNQIKAENLSVIELLNIKYSTITDA